MAPRDPRAWMIGRYKPAQSASSSSPQTQVPQRTQGLPAIPTVASSAQQRMAPINNEAASPVEEDGSQTILGDTAGRDTEDANNEMDGNGEIELNIQRTFERLRSSEDIFAGANTNEILAALEAEAATQSRSPSLHPSPNELLTLDLDAELPDVTSNLGSMHSALGNDVMNTEEEAAEEFSNNTTKMLPPPNPRPEMEPDEASEPILHRRASKPLGNFQMAFGLWCETAGITRSKYISLLNVLSLVQDVKELSQLPGKLDTLRDHCRSQLPLISLRKTSIQVAQEQQPSLSASAKTNPVQTTRSLVFFDPIELVKTMLSSAIFVGKQHRGLAHIVERPCEFFHSPSWGASIRATSGDFARYPSGSVLFPSDFVRFREASDGLETTRLGRVISVWRDMRVMALVKGEIVIRVQEILSTDMLSSDCQSLLRGGSNKKYIHAERNELFLMEDVISDLKETNILSQQEDVCQDWSFDGTNPDSHLPSMFNKAFFIRRIINITGKYARALNLSNPLRAQLEIDAYGREHLEKSFGAESNVISLPFTMFIDGFGLHSRAYRSLLGVYIIPAGMTARERTRRPNVFVLTLGPHGSSIDDVFAAIRSSLSKLDRGLTMMLDGKEVFVCAYTIAFTGDMPQQQANKGLLSQRANYGCGFCLIHAKQRDNLDFDIQSFGRYHHSTLAVRRRGERLNKSARTELFKSVGMREDQTPLILFTPALDIIRSRPADMAHSEFRGMGKMSQELLFTAILQSKAQDDYLHEFQTFPFPPTWPRIQSPQKHLKVWSMAEAGRASIITPVLLRCWLEKQHIDSRFYEAARTVFAPEPVVDAVIRCYAQLARSNTLLGSTSERWAIGNALLSTRQGFNKLFESARISRSKKPQATVPRKRQRATSPASSLGSQRSIGSEDGLDGETEGSAMSEEEDDLVGQQSKPSRFQLLKSRPNMHTGLHYIDVADEYANPSNVDTLMGEDRHRPLKDSAKHTNTINVEETLLLRECVQQTIRFILNESFAEEEGDLTAQIKIIQSKCPAVIRTMLPASEDLEETETSASVITGEKQVLGSASVRIKPTYVRDVLQLPINLQVFGVADEFVLRLRHAYKIDYREDSPTRFGFSTLRWYKKISFSDRITEKRYTYSTEQFVYTRTRGLCRLDQIFVHELAEVRRAFLMLTPVEATAVNSEKVLDIPLLRLSQESIIAGLPVLESQKTWVITVLPGPAGRLIRVKPSTADALLLHCNWDIHVF